MVIKNDKWEKVKLKDVIKIEKNSISPDNLNEGDIYIGLDDIDKETGIIKSIKYVKECDVKSNKFVFTSKHILYGKLRPNLNKVTMPNFSGICSTDIFPINTQKGKTIKEYIYHILHGQDFVKYASSRTNGANLPRVNEKTILDYEISLPPLETQKQIAKTLDTAAELLAMRKQQLAEMDSLIKSTFYDMFGDPVTNEKGWDRCSVGKTIKVIEAGWSADGVKRQKGKDEIAVLKVSAVTSGYFRETEYKVLDKDLNIKKYVFPHKDDLLFSRANTRDLVGATCIIFDDYPDLILPDKLWRIEFKSLANFIYMKYILSDDSVRSSLSNASTGTSGSMYNVSMDKLKSLNVSLPPIELQTQFANIVTKIEEQKSLVKQVIDETQHLFDSLMSEYFE